MEKPPPVNQPPPTIALARETRRAFLFGYFTALGTVVVVALLFWFTVAFVAPWADMYFTRGPRSPDKSLPQGVDGKVMISAERRAWPVSSWMGNTAYFVTLENGFTFYMTKPEYAGRSNEDEAAP